MSNIVSYSKVVNSARYITSVESLLESLEDCEKQYRVLFGESDKMCLDTPFSVILTSICVHLDMLRAKHVKLCKEHYKLIKSQIYPNS